MHSFVVAAVALFWWCSIGGSNGFDAAGHDERKDPFVSGGKDGVRWLNMSDEFRLGHPMRPRVPPPDRATTMVLVAAYREHRCGRTLWDLFRKARHPHNVLVGVVDQRLPEDEPCVDQFCRLWLSNNTGINPAQPNQPESAGPCPFRNNVRTVDVDARQSKGPCYARGLGSKMLPDELPTFCLQTDSHMLFVYDWDVELQDEWRRTENEFAVLTTYAANFFDLDPSGRVKKTRDVPHICQTIWGGHQFPRNQQASAAMLLPRAKLTNLWGAGLSYARCHMEKAVPYDPNLVHIFDGEEYGRMARLWTHGYDTYTPSRNLVLHDYTHVKHFWSGEVSKAGVDVGQEEQQAVPRLETLFGMLPPDSPRLVDIEPYSLGTCRSYDQLVQFTGVETRYNKERTTSNGDQCGQLSWVPYDPSCHDPTIIGSGTDMLGADRQAHVDRAVEKKQKQLHQQRVQSEQVERTRHPQSANKHVAGLDKRQQGVHLELPDLPVERDNSLVVGPGGADGVPGDGTPIAAPRRRLHARLILVMDGLLILLACWALATCRCGGARPSKRSQKPRPLVGKRTQKDKRSTATSSSSAPSSLSHRQAFAGSDIV